MKLRIGLSIIVLVVFAALSTALFAPLSIKAAPDCPVCEWGEKQEWGDADVESFYDAGRCTILQVDIKAATRILSFESDSCVDGYCVSGIGTSQGRVWEDGPRHDISNVSWCVRCPPTVVSLLNVNTPRWTPVLLFVIAAVAWAILIRSLLNIVRLLRLQRTPVTGKIAGKTND